MGHRRRERFAGLGWRHRIPAANLPARLGREVLGTVDAPASFSFEEGAAVSMMSIAQHGGADRPGMSNARRLNKAVMHMS